MEVSRGSRTLSQSYTAVINGRQSVEIRPQVSGTITQVCIAEGAQVKKGQTLAIVEAMKLMNEIESEFDGVVTEILVSNEETVEFGQPLFRIG